MTLPNNELRAILNHVVGRYVRLEDCSEEQRARIDDLVEQRLTGMPLAKIIGTKEFWKRRFITTRDTLDPRPDSETLIEAVFQTCPQAQYRILDLGTGTGCLLISLLEEYPEATGVGVDISERALDIAKQNATVILDKVRQHRDRGPIPPNPSGSPDSIFKDHNYNITNGSSVAGLALAEDDGTSTKRYNFIQSNWCENLSGTFDIIVCNPPYIDPSEPISEGAAFDPPLALYGGIHTYEIILKSIDQHLTCRPQHLFFEIGYTQAAAVSTLLEHYSYHNIQIFKDLSEHDRTIYCCA